MAIVTVQELREQVGLTLDAPDEDQILLQQKGDAAQNHIERMLGFRIEERFGCAPVDPASGITHNGETVTHDGFPVTHNAVEGTNSQIPAALKEAVLQLAAWWFENRDTVTERDRRLPFGVDDIVNEYREWAF